MNKNQVLETLNQLSNECSTEVLIDKLLFTEKVGKGQRDVEEGKAISLSRSKSKVIMPNGRNKIFTICLRKSGFNHRICR